VFSNLLSGEAADAHPSRGGLIVARPSNKLKHPYIVSQEDYGAGSPVIEGTKFPVRSIVSYVLKQGISPEELVKEFHHLSLAQVYDALSYYYDNEAEIERELSEYTEANLKPADSG